MSYYKESRMSSAQSVRIVVEGVGAGKSEVLTSDLNRLLRRKGAKSASLSNESADIGDPRRARERSDVGEIVIAIVTSAAAVRLAQAVIEFAKRQCVDIAIRRDANREEMRVTAKGGDQLGRVLEFLGETPREGTTRASASAEKRIPKATAPGQKRITTRKRVKKQS
jgi:uncharacterized protein YicC (UPF0701 family)